MGPFFGFPKEALYFYKQLEVNNKRDWFEAHKSTYIEKVVEPAQSFVEELGDRLQLLSPAFQYDSRAHNGSIMRIYRDIRFRKDKTPYKTHLGIVFWEGTGKKMENPGYFFHMDANEGAIYAGNYHFDKPFLTAYREAVDDDRLGRGLSKAIKDVEAAGSEVGGEQYARVPRGYDPEHTRADLLRYKGLWSKSPIISAKQLKSPDLIDRCFDYCVAMHPLHKWLVKVNQLKNV